MVYNSVRLQGRVGKNKFVRAYVHKKDRKVCEFENFFVSLLAFFARAACERADMMRIWAQKCSQGEES